MSRRVGIFGGSFDPVHLGHRFLTVYLAESNKLDLVYLLPTNRNPHKAHSRPVSSAHRLKMLKLMFQGVPNVAICTFELKRDPPSYMIDTIHELLEKKVIFPEDSLFLLMGEDLLESFHRWKDVHELVALAKPLIASRSGESIRGEWEKDPVLKKWIQRGMKETPRIDISATEIRRRLKNGQFCGHLLDKSVLNYITRHKLYYE